jgi:hypothetical protein
MKSLIAGSCEANCCHGYQNMHVTQFLRARTGVDRQVCSISPSGHSTFFFFVYQSAKKKKIAVISFQRTPWFGFQIFYELKYEITE